MFYSLKDMLKYKAVASDGAPGSIGDFYFDDRDWQVRYLVIHAGKWRPDRKVLISPVSIGYLDATARQVCLRLTWDQVKNSPSIDMDKPVSRQHEIDLAEYYAWPYYWGARLRGGTAVAESHVSEKFGMPESDRGDSHLRSVKEVTGYSIEASDGEIGHVEEFIVDDGDWRIRYMVVDTKSWLPGKKVLIAPWMITSVRWDKSKVGVDKTREEINDAPEHAPASAIDSQYELHWNNWARPGP